MHKVYISKVNGEVYKIQYKTKFDRQDWYNYIAKTVGDRIEGLDKEKYESIKDNAKNEAKNAVKKYRKELQDIEVEAYKNLPGKYFFNKEPLLTSKLKEEDSTNLIELFNSSSS